MGPESYQIRQNNAKNTAITRTRSFKVTDFGTNLNPIWDFLLVNNTNLHPILCTVSKLWPIIGQIAASDREVPHFNVLTGGDPLRISG